MEFPHMDLVQLKTCVTCTATIDRDQVPSLSSFTYHLFIYSNSNTNIIRFLTLILGTKVPQSLFIIKMCWKNKLFARALNDK
jgi:hypothetical protein